MKGNGAMADLTPKAFVCCSMIAFRRAARIQHAFADKQRRLLDED